MSYLNLPRINFSGRFFTNVSTINNQLSNYPPGATIDPGWNPDGTAMFFFDSCVVNGVQSPGDDGKLLGAPVTTPKHPVNGKLVDIDPDFQLLSQVIGVQVNVATDSGAGFTGLLEPCNFQDIWAPQPTGQGIAGFSQGSALYISTLNSVKWTYAESVEVLRLLRDATADSQKLAIRFVVNSFFFDPGKPNSGFGQMIGSIGPYAQYDPPQFGRRRLMPPAAAKMRPTPGHDVSVQLQAGFFNLDKQTSRLSLDLSNSVPLASFGGPPSAIGQMRAVVLHPDGSADPITPSFSFTPDSYKALGGIVDLSPTAQQCQDLSGMQAGVQLQQQADGPWSLVLSEHVSGKYVNIAPFTVRVVGGESFKYELSAFQWGEPLAGETLDLTAELPASGQPASLAVNGGTGSAVTGPDGRAVFQVDTPTQLVIPSERKELDSLAYGVSGSWTQFNGGVFPVPLPPAALLVWQPYADAGIPNPTWEAQVQPVFDEYARIYPGMKQILDLSQLSDVLANLDIILQAISLPFDAPHRMPVTRDLSPQKIEVIQTWLKNQIAQKKSG